MFESLTALVSDSAWAYVIVLAVAALDALVPIVPSETIAIAAGVLAGAGELSIALVVAAAAAGAFAGDSTSYGLGRTVGQPVRRRVIRGRKGEERWAWAERMLKTHATSLILLARFIPGGRTAATLTAGATRLRSALFFRLAALAAVLWASYASLLGYLGGRAFEREPWRGLVAAFAVAAGIALAVHAVRRLRRTRAVCSA
jgi:membrane-associated protein